MYWCLYMPSHASNGRDCSRRLGIFGWFWMGTLHKNIQLMLEFLKTPFLVLHFSYYTLMTFLMMLSVLLLSMPMICAIYGIWSVVTARIQLVLFDHSNNTSAIDGSVFEEEYILKCWGWLFLLNWIGALIRSM